MNEFCLRSVHGKAKDVVDMVVKDEISTVWTPQVERSENDSANDILLESQNDPGNAIRSCVSSLLYKNIQYISD